jgi:hypothetical protein
VGTIVTLSFTTWAAAEAYQSYLIAGVTTHLLPTTSVTLPCGTVVTIRLARPSSTAGAQDDVQVSVCCRLG